MHSKKSVLKLFLAGKFLVWALLPLSFIFQFYIGHYLHQCGCSGTNGILRPLLIIHVLLWLIPAFLFPGIKLLAAVVIGGGGGVPLGGAVPSRHLYGQGVLQRLFCL